MFATLLHFLALNHLNSNSEKRPVIIIMPKIKVITGNVNLITGVDVRTELQLF